MALENKQRDNAAQSNRRAEERTENMGNSSAHSSSLQNSDDESISTADDTANGKGSRTGIRKDEKEANDNYDRGRA